MKITALLIGGPMNGQHIDLETDRETVIFPELAAPRLRNNTCDSTPEERPNITEHKYSKRAATTDAGGHFSFYAIETMNDSECLQELIKILCSTTESTK